MKWFRRRKKQTPEEAYIERLNAEAKLREGLSSSRAVTYIPQRWTHNHLTPIKIVEGTITADRIRADTIKAVTFHDGGKL